MRNSYQNSRSSGAQDGAQQYIVGAEVNASSNNIQKHSCMLCAQRKIKCDRKSPCSSCIKANVECMFACGAPPPPRRYRKNHAEEHVLARLKR
jgi:hypothetical protein